MQNIDSQVKWTPDNEKQSSEASNDVTRTADKYRQVIFRRSFIVTELGYVT